MCPERSPGVITRTGQRSGVSHNPDKEKLRLVKGKRSGLVSVQNAGRMPVSVGEAALLDPKKIQIRCGRIRGLRMQAAAGEHAVEGFFIDLQNEGVAIGLKLSVSLLEVASELHLAKGKNVVRCTLSDCSLQMIVP